MPIISKKGEIKYGRKCTEEENMKTYNKQSFASLPLTMNTTINSQAMQTWDVFTFAIQVVFTGTPTGSFKLQCSCDNISQKGGATLPLYAPVNWTDIAGSPQSVTSGGSVVWNVSDIGYNYVRVVYTDTSGGTSTAVITSSLFNGKAI